MKTHLERFIRFLAAEKGLSAAYQLSVRQTLEEFARFLGTEDADLSHVDIGTLTEFLRHLQARGMALRLSGNAPAGAVAPPCAGSANRFNTA